MSRLCLHLLHQFVSGATEDTVFSSIAFERDITAEANQRFPLPQFSSQQFGLFEHKNGAFSFRPARPLIVAPLFFVSALAECFSLSSLPMMILDRYGSPCFSARLTDSLSTQRLRWRTCCISSTVQRHKVRSRAFMSIFMGTKL